MGTFVEMPRFDAFLVEVRRQRPAPVPPRAAVPHTVWGSAVRLSPPLRPPLGPAVSIENARSIRARSERVFECFPASTAASFSRSGCSSSSSSARWRWSPSSPNKGTSRSRTHRTRRTARPRRRRRGTRGETFEYAFRPGAYAPCVFDRDGRTERRAGGRREPNSGPPDCVRHRRPRRDGRGSLSPNFDEKSVELRHPNGRAHRT